MRALWITALAMLHGLTLTPVAAAQGACAAWWRASPPASAADPLASPEFYRYPDPAAIANARNGQVFAAEPMTVTEPLQRATSPPRSAGAGSPSATPRAGRPPWARGRARCAHRACSSSARSRSRRQATWHW